jgi:hypothetical protein
MEMMQGLSVSVGPTSKSYPIAIDGILNAVKMLWGQVEIIFITCTVRSYALKWF